MKAKVDQGLCVGSRDCVSACPSVFKMRDGKSSVYVEEVPAGSEDECRKASKECPASAISIEEKKDSKLSHCQSTVTAEHERSQDADEPCDDGIG